jgi:hypothetical protein
VEKSKSEYGELKSKEMSLSADEKVKFEKVKEKLKKTLPRRRVHGTSDKTVALLEKIERSLNITK